MAAQGWGEQEQEQELSRAGIGAADVHESTEIPAAAEARRAAGATNVSAAGGVVVDEEDEDAELEDFALSSGDEDGAGAAGGKEPALDRAMMNELLLVCSNLGMLRVQHEGEEAAFMRGEDCEEWIHDLQRAIRRDHAKFRLVAKQLGKWKILQNKLLPLLLNHQHDWSLVYSILKVLVMLTMKPTKESTNVAQQLKFLRAYKHAFLRHDVVPILMTILVDPLSRKGSARTAQDYLNMELVLTLIRNVLAIPNEDPRFVTSTTTYLSHLQEDFIQTLYDESAYEMILLFAQDIDSAENREWNLLIMEMMDLTLACSHPKFVAAFAKQRLTSADAAAPGEPSASAASRAQRAVPSAPSNAPPAVSLKQALSTEKLSSQPKVGGSRRHSNFGGVLTLVGPTGRSTLLTNFSKASDEQVPQAAKKPVARKRGARQRSGLAADISEVFASAAKVTESDSGTMGVLVAICDAIIAKSYFQLTNSLKNEFRRGSSKLVSTDRLQYFHLVWFLTTYHRLTLQTHKSLYRRQVREHERKKKELLEAMDFDTPAPPAPKKPVLDEKAVLATLDMFSFNFVLQSIETYASVKNTHGMTVSVQLLTEMMSYVTELNASDDPRYQRIADSLQHKILYERDFLDRLPVLLKSWTPGSFSKEYVADVVTLTHLVFKMLDAQGTIKVLSRRKAQLEAKQKKKKAKEPGDASESESDEEEEAERQAQLLLEMQRKEADFDVRRYFQSILSADTVRMYCFLLASYRENSAKVNHYIHAFFYRAKHFRIFPHEDWTMQPLLFNIRVLLLFHRMLQDPVIQRQPDLASFLDFIRGVVRDYFVLADKNRLLFVESLLRQPYAAKSALLLQRNYEPQDSMARSRSEAVALGREKQLALLNEARRQKRAIDAEELEGEEEFQFTLGPSDFQSSSLVAADKSRASGGGGGSESDGEAEFSGLDPPAAASSAAPTTTAAPAVVAAPKKTRVKSLSERAKNWTKVEDRYLEKMYRMYRHLPSVYEVISYEDMFQDRDRTPEQIERRVKYLKLHRKTHDSSDEEDERKSADDDYNDDDERDNGSELEDLDAETAARASSDARGSTRPRRRLRRVTTLSDDSGSEDDLLGILGKSTRSSAPADDDEGARSPDAVDRDGATDEPMDGVPGDSDSLAAGALPGVSGAESDEVGDGDAQMVVAAAGDKGEDDAGVTHVSDRDEPTFEGEPATQALEAAADRKEVDDVQPTPSPSGTESELSAANGVDSTEAVDDAVMDGETELEAAAVATAAAGDEEAATPSNKRGRDPTDDTDASEAMAGSSPHKKAARTEEKEEEEAPVASFED